MLFRLEDLLATQAGITAVEWKTTTPFVADHRYHWRVRAMDPAGNSTPWSRPQSFWFQAAEARHVEKPKTDEAPPDPFPALLSDAQVRYTVASITPPEQTLQENP